MLPTRGDHVCEMGSYNRPARPQRSADEFEREGYPARSESEVRAARLAKALVKQALGNGARCPDTNPTRANIMARTRLEGHEPACASVDEKDGRTVRPLIRQTSPPSDVRSTTVVTERGVRHDLRR